MNRIEGGQPLSKKDQLQKELEKVEGQTRTLELLAPKVLGVGAENAVFALEKTVKGDDSAELEVARHRGVVAKVDLKKMRATLKEDAAHARIIDALPEDEQEAMMLKFKVEQDKKMMDEINESKARWKTLHEYFPKYTMPERYYIQPVPVNRDMFEAATGKSAAKSKLSERLIAVPATIRLQQRIPGEVLSSPETIDLGMGYQEIDDSVTPDDYSNYNDDLLIGSGNSAESYLRQVDKPGKKANFEQLIDQMENDEELRAMMHDFASKAIDYTTNTGEILDIFGAGNIFAHKNKEGKWTMTFMDAIHPNKQLWDEALPYLENIPNQTKFTKEDTSASVNILNYAKNINALAAITGVENRLRLPVSISKKNKDFLSGARRRLGTASIPPSSVTPAPLEREFGPPKKVENKTFEIDQEDDADEQNEARNRPNTEEIDLPPPAYVSEPLEMGADDEEVT